jgi:hypothetical protein
VSVRIVTVENLRFENIGSYNATKHAFLNYLGPNVYLENFLGYRCGWQAIGNGGLMTAIGVEIHNCGFDEIWQKMATGGQYSGIDANGVYFGMRDFHIHHNWNGMKNHNVNVVCKLDDGLFEYNLSPWIYNE